MCHIYADAPGKPTGDVLRLFVSALQPSRRRCLLSCVMIVCRSVRRWVAEQGQARRREGGSQGPVGQSSALLRPGLGLTRR